MDNEITEREKYINDLQVKLTKVIAAQSFEYTDAGKLIIEILTADVNLFSKQVLSDQFLNDHMGYVDARAKANYAASLLGRIQKLNNSDTEKEIRKGIDEALNDEPTPEVPANG